jgi:hypothetical protein
LIFEKNQVFKSSMMECSDNKLLSSDNSFLKQIINKTEVTREDQNNSGKIYIDLMIPK